MGGGGGSLQRTRLCVEFPDLQGIIREFSPELAFLAISASGKPLKSQRFSSKFPAQEIREVFQQNRKVKSWNREL